MIYPMQQEGCPQLEIVKGHWICPVNRCRKELGINMVWNADGCFLCGGNLPHPISAQILNDLPYITLEQFEDVRRALAVSHRCGRRRIEDTFQRPQFNFSQSGNLCSDLPCCLTLNDRPPADPLRYAKEFLYGKNPDFLNERQMATPQMRTQSVSSPPIANVMEAMSRRNAEQEWQRHWIHHKKRHDWNINPHNTILDYGPKWRNHSR